MVSLFSCAITILLFAALIYMAVAGFSGISKGQLPENMMKIVFGKGNFNTDPSTAKTIGTVMLVPPVSIVLGIIMISADAEGLASFFTILGYLSLFGIVIVIAVWSRWFNKTGSTSGEIKPQENITEDNRQTNKDGS